MGSRVPPLTVNEMTEEQRALVGDWSAMNFAAVMAHNPSVYRVLIPLIGKLIGASHLPPRDREVVVLRVLALCSETYEAHHHEEIALAAGMSAREIDLVRSGGHGLSDWDRTLVAAAEQLVRGQQVDDATWARLGARYDQAELTELVSLVGLYVTMAMLTKTLGIPLEEAEVFASFRKLRQYT